MLSLRKTWMVAGSGLIICGVIGMLQPSVLGLTGSAVITVIGDVIYAASVLLFAIGFSREASIVERRPLGVTAMAIVGLWPLAGFILTRLLALVEPSGGSAWTVYGYLSLLIPAAAGLLAAVQIARADAVPSPWRLAPLWVLGAYAVTWAISQIIFVTVRSESIQAFADMFFMLGALTSLAGTLGLGILALVLDARKTPRSVDVYTSR
ncbi:hypothetical protein [Microbacterium sp. A93]|uniref:hypothetical protein n=1 Tax=Microbacterium sp. A93 TaxID=3450716 RepID=UPI003F4256CD